MTVFLDGGKGKRAGFGTRRPSGATADDSGRSMKYRCTYDAFGVFWTAFRELERKKANFLCEEGPETSKRTVPQGDAIILHCR